VSLDQVASGLGPLVDARMTTTVPVGQDWISVVGACDRSRYGPAHRNSLLDARFLLRIVTEQWRAFDGQISRAAQTYAHELREIGNQWAHGEAFNADDTCRALDTMERLLTAIGATEHSAVVRDLRLDLNHVLIRHEAKSASIHARTPGPLARTTRSQSTGVHWTRVTRADVIRAVEEYDRLGQDRFLAEYGFGRATAYLLIYDGRSYDSRAIAGVAYRFATGVPIGAHDFSGGIYAAARVLSRLGFEIRNVRGTKGSSA
jgi:hypothetical protein